jgi:hypothetical protein
VHKAQKLLQRDDLGHKRAREALMWKVRRPEGGFAAFWTGTKAVRQRLLWSLHKGRTSEVGLLAKRKYA